MHIICRMYYVYVTGQRSKNKLHPDYAPCLNLGGAFGEKTIHEAKRALRRFVSFLCCSNCHENYILNVISSCSSAIEQCYVLRPLLP